MAATGNRSGEQQGATPDRKTGHGLSPLGQYGTTSGFLRVVGAYLRGRLVADLGLSLKAC